MAADSFFRDGDLDCISFLLLLLASRLEQQKHSFPPCSCVSGVGKLSLLFLLGDLQVPPPPLLAGAVVMWEVENPRPWTLGSLASWELVAAACCPLSPVCAGRQPRQEENPGPEARRWPVSLHSCAPERLPLGNRLPSRQEGR